MFDKASITLTAFVIGAFVASTSSCLAFTVSASNNHNFGSSVSTSTSLNGLFDSWGAGGSGKDNLDEQWEKQQEILKFRRSSSENKAKYFEDVSTTSHVFTIILLVFFVNINQIINYYYSSYFLQHKA